MKYPNDNIDQIFGQNLSKAEIDLPDHEAFWDRINPQKPKRKRPIFLWLVLGLVGLLAGLWLVNALSNKVDSKINIESEKKTTLVESQTIVSSESLSPVEPKIDLVTEKSSVLEEAQPLVNTGMSSPFVSDPTADSGLVATRTQQVLHYSERTNQVSRNAIKTDATIPQKPLRLFTPVSTKTTKKTQVIPPRTNNYVSALHQLVTVAPTGLNYTRTSPLTIPSLAPFVPRLTNAIVKKRNWYWQLQIEAGLTMDGINLSDDIKSMQFAENYRQQVSPLASYQMQLAVGRKLTRKSRFSVGVEYQHVEKQHKITTDAIIVEKVWHQNAYIRNGDTQGDSIFVEIAQRKVTRKPIRETFINLPLSYYYTMLQRDKITLGLKAGLIMNLSRRLTGPKLNGENDWESVTQQRQTRLGLSYELGVEAIYPLTPHNQFYITPKVRYNHDNHVDEEVKFILRKSMIAVELGFRSAF